MDDERFKSRVSRSKINNEPLSPDEYHYLANDFSEIPKDQRQSLLKRLKKNYFSKNPNDEEDESLILRNIISEFSLDLPEDDFSFNSDILCFMINSCFRHSLKYQDLFESYLPFSLQFLQSDNLIYISSTLSVISTLTSFSEDLSISITSIIPPQLFFNFIMQSIGFVNTEIIYQKIMKQASRILRNIFYPVGNKKIKKSTIKCLFECALTLYQSELLNNYEYCSEILACIRDAIVLREKYCTKIIKSSNWISYFNFLLHSKIEFTQIYDLLIFDQLAKINLGLDHFDIISIIQMISPETNLSLSAISVFSTFLQKCPESSDVYIQLNENLNLLPMLDSILKEGSHKLRMQALNIIDTLIKNASQENKLLIIQMPNLIDSLFEILCNVKEPVIRLIFSILKLIIEISNISGTSDQIKSIFMQSKNLNILEELSNGDDTSSEIAAQILNSLNGEE